MKATTEKKSGGRKLIHLYAGRPMVYCGARNATGFFDFYATAKTIMGLLSELRRNKDFHKNGSRELCPNCREILVARCGK